MKIVIPGGSGQVGTILARYFTDKNHDVVVLSRDPSKYQSTYQWTFRQWDGKNKDEWFDEINGADVVINLAGKNVNCRYTDKNKELIMNSRIDSTKVVGEAIKEATNPPHTWLQASTATIYAHSFDQPNDEFSGVLGGGEENAPDKWDFSVDVAKTWEKTVDEVNTPNTRKVKMRTSLVMSPDQGGIFDTLLSLVRWRLSGNPGSGEQYVSWIHDVDFVRAVDYLINHSNMEGVVNITAPNPLPIKDFFKQLRDVWGIRIGLPATKWMLEIAAFFMRTETELILKSRRVIPGKLANENFEFKFTNWEDAANDLVDRWQELN